MAGGHRRRSAIHPSAIRPRPPQLLEAFLLEKALYEIDYELNNRPDWVAIPFADCSPWRRPQIDGARLQAAIFVPSCALFSGPGSLEDHRNFGSYLISSHGGYVEMEPSSVSSVVHPSSSFQFRTLRNFGPRIRNKSRGRYLHCCLAVYRQIPPFPRRPAKSKAAGPPRSRFVDNLQMPPPREPPPLTPPSAAGPSAGSPPEPKRAPAAASQSPRPRSTNVTSAPIVAMLASSPASEMTVPPSISKLPVPLGNCPIRANPGQKGQARGLKKAADAEIVNVVSPNQKLRRSVHSRAETRARDIHTRGVKPRQREDRSRWSGWCPNPDPVSIQVRQISALRPLLD